MSKWLVLASVVLGALVLITFAGRKSGPSISETNVAQAHIASIVTAGKPVPVIVELFTSEGCSSCPPADDLLARLEKSQPVAGVQIIALGQHVDYWNRLGWADPYSTAAFSERQGDYAKAFGHDGVYTPQMIVDGQTEFPGGNKDRALDAIAKAAQTPKATIEIATLAQSDEEKRTGRTRFAVRVEKLPAISDNDTAEVLLAITESDLSTDVSRGENAGRRLNHAGVVHSLSVIGSLDALRATVFTAEPVVSFAKGWRRENLRVVVFVQERESLRVLGAAAINLAAG